MMFSRAQRSRRCGAVMMETVLVLPVVLVVLALLLGLGRSMTRWQQVAVLDRYEAWRQVSDAPGPQRTDELNEAFLRGRAAELEVVGDDAFPSEPTDLLRDGAAWYSPEAGWFADRVVERLPDGRRVRVTATFVPGLPLESRLNLAGPVHHAHVRLDHEWKFVNRVRYDARADRWVPAGPRTSFAEPIRDRYLETLDGRLDWLETSGNGVARSVRRLYLHEPPYRGPHIDVE